MTDDMGKRYMQLMGLSDDTARLARRIVKYGYNGTSAGWTISLIDRVGEYMDANDYVDYLRDVKAMLEARLGNTEENNND